MSLEDLAIAVYLETPRPPCAGCEFQLDCADNREACEALYTYVVEGIQSSVTAPNKSWYNAIFPYEEHDDEYSAL